MRPNKLRSLLKADKPTLSTHIHTTWPSVVEVEGPVLSHELDVVVEARVPDGFDDGGPRRVNVCGERGLVGLQELAQLVGSHVVSPIVSIPASHRRPGP